MNSVQHELSPFSLDFFFPQQDLDLYLPSPVNVDFQSTTVTYLVLTFNVSVNHENLHTRAKKKSLQIPGKSPIRCPWGENS